MPLAKLWGWPAGPRSPSPRTATVASSNPAIIPDQVIHLSTPVDPNPVVGFSPINDDEAPNSVPDVLPSKPPLLVLVDESVKPVVGPMVSFLDSTS